MGGFAGSVLLHEIAHVGAAIAVGGRPGVGFDKGRPTIYSGIDATREPSKQFAFSSAGLAAQTLLDEGLLDAPRSTSERASAFERGMLAGGLATTLFYITLGRNASVSDVEYMSRTSSLSKEQISLVFGGIAAIHALRITRDPHFPRFFLRPDVGMVRFGVEFTPARLRAVDHARHGP